jgi:hypothetical protein
VGGALYSRFGFRGPFIFSLAVTLLDLVGRIVIVERNDAILWDVDPAAHSASNISATENDNTTNDSAIVSTLADKAETNVSSPAVYLPPVDSAAYAGETTSRAKAKPTSLLTVIRELAWSSCALVVIISTLIFGQVLTSRHSFCNELKKVSTSYTQAKNLRFRRIYILHGGLIQGKWVWFFLQPSSPRFSVGHRAYAKQRHSDSEKHQRYLECLWTVWPPSR